MKRFNEADKAYKNGDWGTKYFVQGPYWEGGVAVFKPGQKLGKHFHVGVTETFYFLEGEGVMVVNDVEYPIKPGEVFLIDANEKHDIINTGNTNLKVLFIKAPFKPDDKVVVQ